MHRLLALLARNRCCLLAIPLLLAFFPAVSTKGQVVVPPGSDRIGATNPPLGYYLAFTSLRDGNWERALDGFQSIARTGIRTVEGAWVDSICYRTMIGECYYRQGNLPAALESYNGALKLFLTYHDWLSRVQFPGGLQVLNGMNRSAVTWTTGTRTFQLGNVPDRFQVLLGNLNNEEVIRRGGVIIPPEFHSINVHEIVRCTALALRRRYELLGPLGRSDALTERLVAVYDTRISTPNHWSQAWVNVQRGYALASAGKFDEAQTAFLASVTLAGQFDHPLTSTALLGLGQMALEANRPTDAIPLLVEASVSAAIYEQPELIEDALQLASDAHLATKPQEPLAALANAMVWAQRMKARHLQSTLSTLSAENFATLSQVAMAAKMLKQTQQVLDRRSSLAAQWLPRHDYVAAEVAYQQGKLAAAQALMQSAMKRQRVISHRQFQIALTEQLYRSQNGAITPRTAAFLFEYLLHEPNSIDWNFRPVDTMCFILLPNGRAFETWFQIVMGRGETEQALEIGDRMRRQRFYSQLPLGGRLLSLRWILSAPESQLTPTDLEVRNDLLTRYPSVRESLIRSRDLRRQLKQLPIAERDDETTAQIKTLAAELDAVSQQHEAYLGDIALRREYCPFAFPPLKSTNEIKAALRPDQLAIIYIATSSSIHAFLLTADDYDVWEVAKPGRLRAEFSKLLTSFGLTSENSVVSIEKLQETDWQGRAQEVFRSLVDRGQFGFWDKFEELIIVPDRILWYLPFEALPTNEPDEEYAPLISKINIRYVPTAGMICHQGLPPMRNPRTAVVAGRLFPRDKLEMASEQVTDMQELISGLELLPKRLPGDSGLLRCTWDRLIVFDEIDDVQHGSLGWSPARIDAGRPGSTLQRWIESPWGGPRKVLLPGFHTATESALKRPSGGDEIFLAVTSLMSTGADTILISRWRTGGMSCYDLMREFIQESGNSSPAESWRRSLTILRGMDFDPNLEPRVTPTRDALPISASHPFLWAGYMLVDSTGNSDRGPSVRAARAP